MQEDKVCEKIMKLISHKPVPQFYRDGEKINDSVTYGYFESVETKRRFYNLWASFDAKLDIGTGDVYGNTHKDYSTSSLPEINELLEKGLLIDRNYLSVKDTIIEKSMWENDCLLIPLKLIDLEGKTIKWKAPIYKHNVGHFGYGKDGGIAQILKVSITERNPIIESIIIEGANPNSIFSEWKSNPPPLNHPLCFSDGDRYVSFEVISDEN